MFMPTLPATFAEACTVLSTGAVDISAYRLHAVPEHGPALIWAHANGFNAGCYQPLLNRLSGHFQVFAFDARGHGASAKPRDNMAHDYAMLRFAEDLGAVAARVQKTIGAATPLHFASHSLGGLAAVLLEAEMAEAPFDSLTLFEPPIYPPGDHEERAAALAHSPVFVRWAAGRRNDFPDRGALRAEVESIITYRRFASDMMAAYLAAVVEAAPDGGLALRCPGAVPGYCDPFDRSPRPRG